MPPAGAAKSERWVSMRPEVQLPEPSRRAVMPRCPLPSRLTFAVEFDIDSTSPVPQFAGPPGELCPVSKIQSEEGGDVPAPPPRLAFQTGVQVGGGGPPLPVVKT